MGDSGLWRWGSNLPFGTGEPVGERQVTSPYLR